MKKNGFTLVELLAVIVLLSLLMVIAIPAALNMGSRVKEKTYDTKIDLMEQAAIDYGNNNAGLVRTSPQCDLSNVLDGENIKYPCIVKTVEELVNAGYLDYDEKEPKKIVTNPVNNYVINECNVYIYYKYERVYAKFDLKTCSQSKENYSDVNHNEYKQF